MQIENLIEKIYRKNNSIRKEMQIETPFTSKVSFQDSWLRQTAVFSCLISTHYTYIYTDRHKR